MTGQMLGVLEVVAPDLKVGRRAAVSGAREMMTMSFVKAERSVTEAPGRTAFVIAVFRTSGFCVGFASSGSSDSSPASNSSLLTRRERSSLLALARFCRLCAEAVDTRRTRQEKVMQ